MSEQARAKQMVTRLAMAMATLLIVAKAYAWWVSGSASMLGSLADSALDLFTSTMMFLAVRYAAEPADDDHRFGHGKAEAIAALAQGGLTAASATLLAWNSIDRLLHPHPIDRAIAPMLISALAIVTTLILVTAQKRVIRATGSVAVEADHAHYQGDVLLNASVMVAIGLEAYLHFKGADSLFALGIAAVILFNGYRAARRAWDMLMDKTWPESEQQALIDAIRANPDVRDVHRLRTRSSGTHRFADFHVSIDGDLTVREADRIVHQLEAALEARFAHTHFLIHVDPHEEGHEL